MCIYGQNFENLQISAAPVTHFKSIFKLGGVNSIFVGWPILVLTPSINAYADRLSSSCKEANCDKMKR